MNSSACENNSSGTGHTYTAHYTHIARHPYSLHYAFIYLFFVVSVTELLCLVAGQYKMDNRAWCECVCVGVAFRHKWVFIKFLCLTIDIYPDTHM